MYSIKRANRYLMIALITFIVGSLILGVMVSLGLELGIISQIIISQWGIVFIPIVMYFLITKAPVKETLILRPISRYNALMSVGISFSILPLLSLINVLSQFFVKNSISDAVLEIADKPLWISLFLMAITPAIIEEFAMRGIITSNYRSTKVLTTCLINGLFFGMFHMNINQFLYAFVMGAIMCFVVHVTGTIYASMIMHFVINSTSLILAKIGLLTQEYLASDPNFAEQMNQAALSPMKSLIAGSILMFFLSAIFIPLAILLITNLMKTNQKTHILQMTTGEVLFGSEDFASIDGLNLPEYPEGEFPSTINGIPIAKEKIVTPSFIISISIFVLFVVAFEIIVPLFT